MIQPGLDSALTGFDASLRIKPASLGFVNGSFEIGGYGYSSDLIDHFGGIRGRMGMQLPRGFGLGVELTHDNRFDFTGAVALTFQYGANARGNEYAGLGRDLEPTIRNDHIVRFQQDTILAIDPDTGLPYNVFHVDNTADPNFEDGRAQTPFTTLLAAQNASGPDDIIFVREGDGTTNGMNAGIVLQDGQLLLGDGVQHLIPIQNGQLFELCNDQDGIRPTITNNAAAGIVLANRNTVRGFIIDGSTLTPTNAIEGIGTPVNPLTDGIIEDVTITGGTILNGIFLEDIAGDWRFARNTISDSNFDGIFIDSACDPNSVFEFVNNVVNNNGRDGIHMENFDLATFTYTNNTTNNNGRNGLHLENFKNGAGTGGDFQLISPTASGNLGNGIFMSGIDGNVQIIDPTITNNVGNGIRMLNVTNTDPAFSTFIGPSAGGTSTITGNGIGAGAGVNVELTDPNSIQRLLVTGSTINGGGIGVQTRAGGSGAQLFSSVIDNISVSNNVSSGMRFIAEQGGINTVVVQNTGGALPMTNNGTITGSGIDFFAGDANGGNVSTINATVTNVNIAGQNGAGIRGNVVLDGQLRLAVDNVTLTGGTQGLDFDLNTNATGALNEISFTNSTINTPAGTGASVNVGNSTFADINFVSNTITGGGATGINMNFTGASRTRLVLRGNNVSNFVFDGVSLASAGTANVLSAIDGNDIRTNGPGTDPTMLPYFDGLDISAGGTSTFNTVITNNVITANQERGLDLRTTAGSTINAVVIDNNFGGNDLGEDAPLPPITSGLIDVAVTNNAAGTICLAMSNNFYALPANITNFAGGAAFTIELDGLTNGPAATNLFGAFTTPPFGSTCQPAIDAEDVIFQGLGFPPLQP